jgi:hypothetical protein
VDLLRAEAGSYTETCRTSCLNGNGVIRVKVENITDTEEGDDPLPIIFPVIKVEREVSTMTLCTFVGTFHRYLNCTPCTQFLVM